jgi:hypothetical protein
MMRTHCPTIGMCIKNAAYYIIWEHGNLNPTLAARFEFRGVSIEK